MHQSIRFFVFLASVFVRRPVAAVTLEIYPDELEEDIEAAIEDGVFDKDQYRVFLIHS